MSYYDELLEDELAMYKARKKKQRDKSRARSRREAEERKLWAVARGLIDSYISQHSEPLLDYAVLLLPEDQQERLRFSRIELPLGHVRIWSRKNTRETVCVVLAPKEVGSEGVVGLARLVSEFGLRVQLSPKSSVGPIEIWRSKEDQEFRSPLNWKSQEKEMRLL